MAGPQPVHECPNRGLLDGLQRESLEEVRPRPAERTQRWPHDSCKRRLVADSGTRADVRFALLNAVVPAAVRDTFGAVATPHPPRRHVVISGAWEGPKSIGRGHSIIEGPRARYRAGASRLGSTQRCWIVLHAHADSAAETTTLRPAGAWGEPPPSAGGPEAVSPVVTARSGRAASSRCPRARRGGSARRTALRGRSGGAPG